MSSSQPGSQPDPSSSSSSSSHPIGICPLTAKISPADSRGAAVQRVGELFIFSNSSSSSSSSRAGRAGRAAGQFLAAV